MTGVTDLSTADVTAQVIGSWGLVFTLVGVAALLTVVGLALLVRGRRSGQGSTTGGRRR